MENILMSMIHGGGQKDLAASILSCNKITEQFGLSLTQAEAGELLEVRRNTLKNFGRIEFEGGVVDKIIKEFCDSPYISQHNYVEIIAELIEIFYYYKNESLDELSDDELLELMKDYFNNECMGDLEVLRDRDLDKIAWNIRYGDRDCEEGVRLEVWEGHLEYYFENTEE